LLRNFDAVNRRTYSRICAILEFDLPYIEIALQL